MKFDRLALDIHYGIAPFSPCLGLGAKDSTGGKTLSTGGLGGLCFVGEKPGLLGLRLWRAGPLTGLVDGFGGGARGDLCLTGERPADSFVYLDGGLLGVFTLAEYGATARGDVCFFGDKPEDGGASR